VCIVIHDSKPKEALNGTKRAAGRSMEENQGWAAGEEASPGAHWRELPSSFGAWNSVCQRSNRCSKAGVWERLFHGLSDDPDFEYIMIDSTIVRAHQHNAGPTGGPNRRKPLAVQKAG
jgi:hypothetical protein